MNLSEKYANNILKAMFRNYDFDFTISTPDDDMILFDINTDNIDTENNQIELYISKITDESNQIVVKVNKRSEDYEIIGVYYINEDYFEQSSSFWETMFIEHLLF